MRVVIVGAGIVGAATAFELARRGLDVDVLDRGEIGHGCSFGNAGWLTPCFATPLPAPGVLSSSLRWLVDPDSPFFIRPSLRIEWLRWLARFARSTTAARFESGVRALVPLSTYSLETFAALDAASPGSFAFSRRGLLLVAQTPKGLDGAVRGARGMEEHGVEARVLSATEVRDLEPAVRGLVAGGVFFPGAAHCEPLLAVRALARAAAAAGAQFSAGTESSRSAPASRGSTRCARLAGSWRRTVSCWPPAPGRWRSGARSVCVYPCLAARAMPSW